MTRYPYNLLYCPISQIAIYATFLWQSRPLCAAPHCANMAHPQLNIYRSGHYECMYVIGAKPRQAKQASNRISVGADFMSQYGLTSFWQDPA